MAGGCSDASRQEVADDLFRRANADLDVIQFAKTRSGIQFASFEKKSTDRVKWLFAFPLANLVKGFDYRTVEKTHLKRRTPILGNG